jgi:formate dehydrogenase
LADELAAADGAFVTTRVGVQTSHNSTLTEWAVQTLNAVTGNVDRPGGVYFNPGAIDVPKLVERFTKRKNPARSRIGDHPQIFGGPPAAVFADDVLSDDPDRIRALIVVGGNPVLTFPNTEKIERALRRLELLVTVDLYLSDTGTFAHYNLPATFEPHPFAEWKPKIVEPRGETRSEWGIFRDLARAAGVPFLNNPAVDAVDRLLGMFGSEFTHEHLARFLLLGKTTLGRLKKAPGGIRFGDIQWGEFLSRSLQTDDADAHLRWATRSGLQHVDAQRPRTDGEVERQLGDAQPRRREATGRGAGREDPSRLPHERSRDRRRRVAGGARGRRDDPPVLGAPVR